MKICPYCGKQGLDFDRATDGVECKKPVVYSLAVGDWVCAFRAENSLEGESGMERIFLKTLEKENTVIFHL